jgi:hypothetical protein
MQTLPAFFSGARKSRSMKFVRPSPRQAETIVQAVYAVVSAEGTVDPIPLEVESIDAAQRHLLHGIRR